MPLIEHSLPCDWWGSITPRRRITGFPHFEQGRIAQPFLISAFIRYLGNTRSGLLTDGFLYFATISG